MEFTIEKSALDQVLKTVQFALLTRPSMPVLNNVHINVEDDNTATFTLTDMEIDISCKVSITTDLAGGTTIPVRRLISIVRKLPNLPVHLELTDEQFTRINCGQIFYQLQGICASEYPHLVDKLPEQVLDISKKSVQRMMVSTSFACGNDSSRPATLGPLLEIDGKKLNCVATDGRRLAISSIDLEESKPYCGCIIPPKTVAALMKLMAGEGQTSIHFNQKKIHFSFISEFDQETTISSNLIEARFPNYRTIIPEEHIHSLNIPREEFYSLLKRAALILSDSNQAIKLKFTNDLLHINAKTDFDRSQEELPISFDGEELTIPFNPAFLIEPLNKLDDELVTLDFSDSHKAVILHDSHNFRYILMPMRA
ncbi:MAG: DNA polymerase III subunit beta [Lentisphaeraceae bacterium]|nr:DNA polymerase III subunit beta [Lentisphaeraceae bacterium]